MMILEKDLEEMIYSASQCDEGKAALARRGLIIRGKLYRQVSLGNYGRLDLVDVAIKDKALYVNIIELKAEKIGSETIAQVLRYKYAIKNWLKVHYKDTFQSIKIISTVIGSELKDDGIEYIAINDTNIKVFIYSLNVTGLHFDNIRRFTYFEDFEINKNFSRDDLREMYGIEVQPF